jgi:hypothetical protein
LIRLAGRLPPPSGSRGVSTVAGHVEHHPLGSLTKKRRTPHGSSVSGCTSSTPRRTASAWTASTSDELTKNEQTAPGSPHHRGRSLGSSFPSIRALHHSEALHGLGGRTGSTNARIARRGGLEAPRLTLDPPPYPRTCTAPWLHAHARSRTRPPANKSGRLPPGAKRDTARTPGPATT